MTTRQPAMRLTQFELEGGETCFIKGDDTRRVLAIDVSSNHDDYRVALTVQGEAPVHNDWVDGVSGGNNRSTAVLIDTGCSSDIYIENSSNSKEHIFVFLSDVKINPEIV